MTVDELIAHLRRFRGDAKVMVDDNEYGPGDPRLFVGSAVDTAGVVLLSPDPFWDANPSPIPPEMLRETPSPDAVIRDALIDLGATDPDGSVTVSAFKLGIVLERAVFRAMRKAQSRIVPEPLISPLLRAVERLGVARVVVMLEGE